MTYKPQELEGKLITCILPRGKGRELLNALSAQSFTRFNFAYVRGFDIHDPEAGKGLPNQVEKETVTLVCKDTEEAEAAFDFIYKTSGIDTLGGGIMYMTKLSGATLYNLPSEF